MKVLISGLVNIETTVAVQGFPIPYFPIDYPFFGVNAHVSGVGYNLARAFSALGDKTELISFLGSDDESERILKRLEKDGFSTDGIIRSLKNTPVSVVLFDHTGKRQIYCDLKDIQEKKIDTDSKMIEKKIADCDIVCACNTGFNRPLIRKAVEMAKPVATDVHILSNADDEYNRDFMKHAGILFLSDEGLPCSAKEFIQRLEDKYHSDIIVIGMGSSGAMLLDGERQKIWVLTAAKCGNVVNTVGAGDALFSAFIHYYLKGFHCIDALKRAEMFAAIKIGFNGASVGFGSEQDIENALEAAGIECYEV